MSKTILFLDAYYGGSHKQLTDLLFSHFASRADVFTLTPKKWHWRARTAALTLSQRIPRQHNYRVLFTSSVLNLAELVALRGDLSPCTKILYMHENQLVYPVVREQNGDFQYGYNQILSALVADRVVFNSKFNMDSFLKNIAGFLKKIPSERPENVADVITAKSTVLYFPVQLPPREAPDAQHGTDTASDTAREQEGVDGSRDVTEACSPGAAAPGDDVMAPGDDVTAPGDDVTAPGDDVTARPLHMAAPGDDVKARGDDVTARPLHMAARGDDVTAPGDDVTARPLHMAPRDDVTARPLHIVWPHRWEHDKGPELLAETLLQLAAAGLQFRLSVLGQAFSQVPAGLRDVREQLGPRLLHWGRLASREEYYQVLRTADVVLSTAKHEFFGVAMLEAAHLGCHPLAPNGLVYPELYPPECLYNTPAQLLKRLRYLCRNPGTLRGRRFTMATAQYGWDTLRPRYEELLTGA